MKCSLISELRRHSLASDCFSLVFLPLLLLLLLLVLLLPFDKPGQCAASDVVSLRLITALFERAPKCLTRTGVVNKLPTLLDVKNAKNATALEATIEAICGAAIATEHPEMQFGMALVSWHGCLPLDCCHHFGCHRFGCVH